MMFAELSVGDEKVRGRRWKNCLQSLLKDRKGNFGLMFALASVPVIMGVGCSIDYVTAYNAKTKMQSDLDAALIASVKQVGTLDNEAIKVNIAKWFNAQTELGSDYTLNASDISIDTSGHAITAKVSAPIKTSLLQIAGIETLNISAASSVTGTATDYINVYIVLDKSASMLLAATTAGQSALISKTAFYKSKSNYSDGCVFACHTSLYSGRSSNYDIAVANNIQLRADVQLSAVKEVLELVNTANSEKDHVKVGYYTLGTSTTGSNLLASNYKTVNGIHTVQSPIYGYSTLTSLLTTSTELSSSTSYNSSDFRALQDLASIVGTQGDGSSESKPLKIVMLITDGAQSSMGWVGTSNSAKYITPMNPNWCSSLKTNGVTMAVLYTEYLAVTAGDDVANYNASMGATMANSYWTSTWKGTSSALTSTIRKDYIKTSLSNCASNADYFIAANSPSDIKTGFSDLLTTYLSAVRLTQ